MKTREKKEGTVFAWMRLWTAICLFSLGICIGGLVFGCETTNLTTAPAILSTLTKTIDINSDGGILSINMTFSNISDLSNKGLLKGIVYYKNYTINSAMEELPNGTVVTVVQDYIQKQAEIAVRCGGNSIDNLGVINGITYRFICSE